MKIDQVVLEKKRFKDSMALYLYIAQGQGQITPGGGCGGGGMGGGRGCKILILTKMFYYL